MRRSRKIAIVKSLVVAVNDIDQPSMLETQLLILKSITTNSIRAAI